MLGRAPEYIIRVNFYGIVRLGSFAAGMPLPGGLSVPCGIYDATLFNVSVGDGALITNVHGYIANYDIGAHTYIADVGKIYMEGVSSGVSSFGNGTEINVLNETGGRSVTVYDGMSAQTAYFSAMYRHRPALTDKLREMALTSAAWQKSDRGRIGSYVKVENVGMLRNMRIGDHAVIQGCLRLFDGTVASTKEAPALMGSGVGGWGTDIQNVCRTGGYTVPWVHMFRLSVFCLLALRERRGRVSICRTVHCIAP